jgi:hypothetical protein
MLLNNAAYLFVDKSLLDIFQNTSCSIGLLIGGVI